MKFLVGLFSLLLPSSACKFRELTSQKFCVLVVDASFRIVGGNVTDITKVPYQASVLNFAIAKKCGGSILNKTAILTAAHCLVKASAKDLKVRVGSNEVFKGGTQFNVTKYLMHPKYDDIELTYDVAIIILNGEISYSNSVKAVTLPKASDDDVKENTEGLVSGWGVYNYHKREPSKKLKSATVKVLLQKSCESIIKANAPSVKTVPKSFFCLAGENFKHGACLGDSGGPFVTGDKLLLGVVSWGFACGYNKLPGVFSKVAFFLNFINYGTE